MKLRGKLLLMSILPMVVVSVVTIIVIGIKASASIKDEIENGLISTALAMRDDVSSIDGNNYWVDEAGNLWNGSDYNVTEDTEGIDAVLEKTGIAVTVFYGDTRYATSVKDASGKRILGTQASPEVTQEVLVKGNEYFSSNASVNGEKYFAYYVPMYNDGSDTPVGMIFAGQAVANVNRVVQQLANICLATTIVSAIIVVLIVSSLALKMSRRFKKEVGILESVSTGDLTVELDASVERNKDESGDIAKSVHELKDKLTGIIGEIKRESKDVNALAATLGSACEDSARNIETVESAVNDIAQGATKQAGDTTSATEQVMNMGVLVENTNETVNKLNEASDKMEESGAEAEKTLSKLQSINEKAKASIDIIYEQTNTTNESAQKISEAVSLITSIAEETNLLSLNASIEAARAGEQGKGFAVVASQISKLAEQSSESAQRIEEIVSSLISDSEKAVATMDEVKEIMDSQSEMVGEAGDRFNEVIGGIKGSRESTREIIAIMAELNKTREKVVNYVSNLSGVAQENAASTEETSASVTMIGSALQEIAAEAERLREIADSLNDSVNTFSV